MAKKIKVSNKKSWKEPDEFVSKSTRIFEYVLENQKKILQFSVGVLVAVLILAGWRMYSKRVEGKASDLYYQAIGYYNVDENMEKTANKEEDKYSLALGKMKEIIKEYPRTDIVLQALLYAGHIQYGMGDFDESIKSYRSFLDKSSADDHLRGFALDGLGYAYEAKGDYKNAMIYFRKFLDNKENHLNRMGYYNIGRCHEELGEKDEAIEAYRQALAAYPNSGYSALARERIKVLQRQMGNEKITDHRRTEKQITEE